MTRRLLILGAGASGRAHLAQVAHEAGWELVLADRDRALIETLRRAGRYRVRLCRAEGQRLVVVDRFRAYGVEETDALQREALGVSLVLTCVFSENLPAVAPVVAGIIAARQAAGLTEPLNVIACENMPRSSTVLRGHVWPLLEADARAYAQRHVGFPDAMISRVAPRVEDPLDLLAEDYNEWTVDARAFVGPAPDLPGLELVANQEARLARKFYMHNSGHAVCAYRGLSRGHTFVHEAVADPVVAGHVSRAVEELARVVARRYGFSYDALVAYGMELGRRGAVAALQDQLRRVVRDPLRKLSRHERLVAPAVWALEDGTPCDELVETIGLALRYRDPDDPGSAALAERLHGAEPRTAVAGILGLPADHPLVARVCGLALAIDGRCS